MFNKAESSRATSIDRVVMIDVFLDCLVEIHVLGNYLVWQGVFRAYLHAKTCISENSL